LDKSVKSKEEHLDHRSLYIYAMKAPMTRLRLSLSFVKL